MAQSDRTSKTYQALTELIQQNARMRSDFSVEMAKAKDEIISQLHSTPDAGSPAASFQTIESLLRYLSQNALDVDLKTRILSSLYFNEIHDRFDQIKMAADDTFKWISNLSDTQSHQKTVHFTEWLKSQEPGDCIFWISGKPGSGKSLEERNGHEMLR